MYEFYLQNIIYVYNWKKIKGMEEKALKEKDK